MCSPLALAAQLLAQKVIDKFEGFEHKHDQYELLALAKMVITGDEENTNEEEGSSSEKINIYHCCIITFQIYFIKDGMILYCFNFNWIE